MDEATQSRVFEPFAQHEDSGLGAGLGLAICRALIGTMDGSLSVVSAPGAGSRFELRLPRPPAIPRAPGTEALVLPDPRTRAELVELVRRGDMAALSSSLDDLNAAELAPFVARARAAAREFDEDAMLALLDGLPEADDAR